MPKPINHQRVRLPAHPFFYTLDQVAIMLNLRVSALKLRVFFVGRTSGRRTPTQLEAMNIAEPGKAPDWRIDERELLRWLAVHGYQVDRI